MQQNSKCRLYRNKEKTVNHIINECRKLAQKEYKTRHNWKGDTMGKYNRLKCDHTTKWYMHKPESVLEYHT